MDKKALAQSIRKMSSPDSSPGITIHIDMSTLLQAVKNMPQKESEDKKYVRMDGLSPSVS